MVYILNIIQKTKNKEEPDLVIAHLDEAGSRWVRVVNQLKIFGPIWSKFLHQFGPTDDRPAQKNFQTGKN